jgi:hypothetical protein
MRAGISQSLQRLDYGRNDRRIGVRFPAAATDFSLVHNVQIGSGAHPASYPISTGAVCPG